MIEAWFSSSEMMTSPSPTSTGMTPALQVKPLWKTTAASVCLKRASRSSSSRCRGMVPMIVRTAPVPAPQRSVAWTVAAFRRGSSHSPR